MQRVVVIDMQRLGGFEDVLACKLCFFAWYVGWDDGGK